ncbi:DNA-binding transcriptional regulator YhcF, GntR family [Clostridium cavendishii DSM 21758]|uniref:DNA-binding transcriptional regulator YhcF, GntR family n=1 Tax=Clostridium cavendishii DSM 21758 TaxID=1121302 RepID=A0A1M6T4K7_9CLOT|nr:GntR family transcriptional regulator [Clostridium cavendishii]SHK51903.1 DNA-binding transcriptional regulator YhcF, GntR family [Clostridium cavendishii DSM 21758]
MVLNTDSMKPIYLQISEWIENQILNNNILVNEKVFSQYQLAEMYNINPATAGKGLSVLLNENIIYKKRGLGMFVSPGAKEIIFKKRKNETLKNLITQLIIEADRLNVSDEELFQLIKSIKKNIKEE